jgi:hypothetical protein
MSTDQFHGLWRLEGMGAQVEKILIQPKLDQLIPTEAPKQN